MKKILLILLLIPFFSFAQTDESVETTVPIWYGNRQLEPFDESETVQIILDRNDTTFFWSSNQGIYINNLLNSTGFTNQQDLTSQNILTVDWTNEAFNVTTISNQLRLLDRTNCVEGRKFVITIPIGSRIVHNYTASSENRPFILNGSTDINATEKTSILFVAYDSDSDNIIDSFREVGRASGTETDPPPTIIQFSISVESSEIVAAGGELTVTPEVTFSSGTVKLYDGLGNEFTLSSGVPQNVEYTTSDLNNDTILNHIWTLSTTAPLDISDLDFDNCNITIADITELTGLKNIVFNNNKLTNFTVGNGIELRAGGDLMLYNNELTSVDLKNMVFAGDLRIQGNNNLHTLITNNVSGSWTNAYFYDTNLSTINFGNITANTANFKAYDLPTLNNLIFNTNITISSIFQLYNNDNLVTIDFTKVTFNDATLKIDDNSELTTINFGSGSAYNIDLTDNPKLTAIDLTNIFVDLDGNNYFYFNDNALLETVDLDQGDFSAVLAINGDNCPVLTSIDFGNVEYTGTFASRIDIYNCPSLTTFDNFPIDTILNRLNLYDNNITGTLDLSKITGIGGGGSSPALSIYNNPNLTDVTFAPTVNCTVDIRLDNTAIGDLDWDNFINFGSLINVSNCGMSATEHDNTLININTAANTYSITNKTLTILTGNTARTSASDAAFNNLTITLGWTIN